MANVYAGNGMQTVISAIREKINTGVWKCGDRIWTETEFVENLGVSRLAVRQAIERLCVMSIVRKVQGSGTYVEDADNLSLSSFLFFQNSQEDLLDILYFRLSFENSNIALFFKNSTVDDMEALGHYCRKMIENQGDSDVYYKYDFLFHKALAKGTHNKFVEKISDLLFQVLEKNQRVVQETYVEIGVHQKSEHDVHEIIYQYIREGDLGLARAMMDRHIMSTITALEESRLSVKLPERTALYFEPRFR